MTLAARIARLAPSPTLTLSATAKAMAAEGIDLVDFSTGEPAGDTPDHIKQAAIDALAAGHTKYTPVAGIPELKQAIIDTFARDQGLHFDPADILVSCGAKHSLYLAAQALLDPGDQVIIPSPYWVSYPDIVRLAGGAPIILPITAANGGTLDPDHLAAALTPRTKALILNSPCNPTGAIIPADTLDAIAHLARRHPLTIITDDIYRRLVYDHTPCPSLATLAPDLADHTLIINGVSKTYAMTGWRIGYAAGPRDVIAAMTAIQSQSTSNPTSIAQHAALAALRSGPEFTAALVRHLDTNRRTLVHALNTIPGITCPLPAGAFYAWPDITPLLGTTHPRGRIHTAADLAAHLLRDHHLATIPGDPFGSPHHLRLTYTPAHDIIDKGITRLRQAIKALT